MCRGPSNSNNHCSANSRVYYAILFHHFLPYYPHTVLVFLLSEVTNHNIPGI